MEEFLSLSEVKKILEKEKKEREELTQEQTLALEHAKRFSKLSPKQAGEMMKELMRVEHVTEQHAAKIADLLPTRPTGVRAIFAKERFTLDKSEVKKIVGIVEKYL